MKYRYILTLRRRHHYVVLLLFLAICAHHPTTTAAEVEIDAGGDTIKVMVGFKDVEEQDVYIAQEAVRVQTAKENGDEQQPSKIKYQFKNTNAIAMEVTRAEYEEMQKDPRFSYIEEDYEVKLASVTSEEKSRRLAEIFSYAIIMTQSQEYIPPPPADTPATCVVYTCIVDSGVYVNHEDIPYNRGDGYISGRSFGTASGDLWYRPIDTNHGTNVAGIMFATPNNQVGIVGVVQDPPQTSRICVRVAKVFPDGSDSTSISTVIEAVEWCSDESRGAPMIINLSLATPSQMTTERRSYERIYEKGNVLFVAAAGNGGDSEFSFPASHDSVISVASVNSVSQRSSFSQFNNAVELAAPGSGIHVTTASETGIDVSSGTSYACPFVAAIAARIWAANPRCDNSHVREALRESAQRLGNSIPNDETGYGLVQAKAAFNYLRETIGCGVPTAEPSSAPTKLPSASPSSLPSGTPSQSPSKEPTFTPSGAPSGFPTKLPSVAPSNHPSVAPSSHPTETPTIDCLQHLEPCTADKYCCEGFSCLRMSSDDDDSWACRRETEQLFNTKPRLAAYDGGRCRGGNAGNCPFS